MKAKVNNEIKQILQANNTVINQNENYEKEKNVYKDKQKIQKTQCIVLLCYNKLSTLTGISIVLPKILLHAKENLLMLDLSHNMISCLDKEIEQFSNL